MTDNSPEPFDIRKQPLSIRLPAMLFVGILVWTMGTGMLWLVLGPGKPLVMGSFLLFVSTHAGVIFDAISLNPLRSWRDFFHGGLILGGLLILTGLLMRIAMLLG